MINGKIQKQRWSEQEQIVQMKLLFLLYFTKKNNNRVKNAKKRDQPSQPKVTVKILRMYSSNSHLYLKLFFYREHDKNLNS
jgi:hypothetical protein